MSHGYDVALVRLTTPITEDMKVFNVMSIVPEYLKYYSIAGYGYYNELAYGIHQYGSWQFRGYYNDPAEPFPLFSGGGPAYFQKGDSGAPLFEKYEVFPGMYLYYQFGVHNSDLTRVGQKYALLNYVTDLSKYKHWIDWMVQGNIWGDTDGSGSITPLDAFKIYQCAQTGCTNCPQCDVDFDQSITQADAFCVFDAFLEVPGNCLESQVP